MIGILPVGIRGHERSVFLRVDAVDGGRFAVDFASFGLGRGDLLVIRKCCICLVLCLRVDHVVLGAGAVFNFFIAEHVRGV